MAASKAYFDVFVGRTAQEVIQVRSLLYPWGVRRRAHDHVDARQQRLRVPVRHRMAGRGRRLVRLPLQGLRRPGLPASPVTRPSPYKFHPGLVNGVFNVRNIREGCGGGRSRRLDEERRDYLDREGMLPGVAATTPASVEANGHLQPVYFDADVEIESESRRVRGAGAVEGDARLRAARPARRANPAGPVRQSAVVAVRLARRAGRLRDRRRLERAADAPQPRRRERIGERVNPIFVGAARGALILPKDGAWSVVQHDQGTGEVSPLDPQAAVPLIRRGNLAPDEHHGHDAADLMRVANPVDIVQSPVPPRATTVCSSRPTRRRRCSGCRLPAGRQGAEQHGAGFRRAYRIVNSKAIFPNVKDTSPAEPGRLQDQDPRSEGYKLVDAANPDKVFEQGCPAARCSSSTRSS